ncbi:DMT family transporter [Streptomyces sp. Tue6028]|uniref:DMT family transporter n=1 Tax=Streptomyces sp. Tue6028 TaxID=2036037 RepID=UPI003D754D31
MNAVLYVVTVLLWGSTWLAIKGQLGSVHPTVSIAYRFALASLMLLAFARARGLPLRYPLGMHGRFALMGVTMFSANFVCFYFAEQHIAAALVSIIFAMSLVVNMLFARLFFCRTLTTSMMVGGAVGLTGIVTVFWPEFEKIGLSSGSGQGVVLSVVGTLVFCSGNVVSAKTQAVGIPVIQGTGYAMAYGALVMAPFALVYGHDSYFESTWQYTGSLFYLSVFGSVLGFGAYLTLLGRVGGERAAYAMVLFPIVALLLSTFFEDFNWTVRDLTGVVLTLTGNGLVLARSTRDRCEVRAQAPPDVAADPARTDRPSVDESHPAEPRSAPSSSE